MKRIYNYRTNKLYEFENIQDSNIVNESEEDAVVYKLCVREEALVDDVDVEDDVEFEDVYETLEDALADVEDAMTKAAETEDEDFEELDCEGCDDCRVFESPSKRYIFVACPVDEEPDFEIDVVDGEVERELDDEDLPLDDIDYEYELDVDLDDEDDDEKNESVSMRFARLCKMFESEGVDENEDENEEASDDKEDASNDGVEDKEDDVDSSDENTDTEDEDEEMKAVAITVKTDDVDACKDELIEAGVAEDDIEVLDDNDGETEIRIDVNSVMELKDYLAKKGIDLEEEIGGEIVSDDEDTEDVESEDGSDEESEEQDVEDINFDDLGDLFGADEE